MADDSLKQQFEEELGKLPGPAIYSPEYLRKKLIVYSIRTAVAVALYALFWKYQWVRWSLWVYLPLNLLSLFYIVGWNCFLRRKIGRARKKIEEADAMEIEPGNS